MLGRTPSRSEQVAAQLDVPRGYASLDDVIADAPDVVHVCTPNDQHHPQALAVIRAGINVVCEKPLAISAAQAAELVDAADRAGVVATVPFVYRYHPVVREIRGRIAAGELGRMLAVHGHYLQDWMLDEDASSWRVDAGAGGVSRAFADIGSHWCDLVEFVTGEPFASVSAATDIVYPTRPAASGPSFSGSPDPDPVADAGQRAEVTTEDTAVATFRTASGRIGNVVISQVAAGRKNRLWFEVDGTLGSAAFDQSSPSRRGSATSGAPRSSSATRRSASRTNEGWPSCRPATAGVPRRVRGLRRRHLRGGPQRGRPVGVARRAADVRGRRPCGVDHRGGHRQRGRRIVAGDPVKLGMLTACLPGWSLERIAAFAAEQGYERLEVAVWPTPGRGTSRRRTCPSPPSPSPTPPRRGRCSTGYGLEISALAYYENNLHHDTDHRAAVKEHLFHAVDDAAAMLGVPSVGTFVGRDNTLSVRDNMALGDRVLPELVEYAGERGVRLIVENCVMEGWHPDGYPGNLAYSPSSGTGSPDSGSA